MAHEIENVDGRDCFIYRGQPAWHGLGQPIEGEVTAVECLDRAGLNWTVGLRPLFIQEPDGIVMPTNTHQAVVRSSDQKVLGVVGDSYTPFQNADMARILDKILASGKAEVETAMSLRGGSRVVMLLKVKDDTAEVVAGDPVESYILAANSHDGSMRLQLGFTPTRVVCANTLRMAQQNEASQLVQIFHRSGIVQTAETVAGIMDLARREFVASMEVYRYLASKRISKDSLEKYIKQVFGVTAEGDGKSRVLAEVIPLFDSGIGQQIAGVAGTYWAAYNAVTEHLTHHAGRSQDTRLNSLYFGTNAQRNQTALSLAAEMAKAA